MDKDDGIKGLLAHEGSLDWLQLFWVSCTDHNAYHDTGCEPSRTNLNSGSTAQDGKNTIKGLPETLERSSRH